MPLRAILIFAAVTYTRKGHWAMSAGDYLEASTMYLLACGGFTPWERRLKFLMFRLETMKNAVIL